VCEGDQDGDKILDNEDASPFNKKISNRAANFHQFQIVALRVPPYKESEWIVLDEGTKIRQNKNSDATAAIGLSSFSFGHVPSVHRCSLQASRRSDP
jgi:hypothetical protein